MCGTEVAILQAAVARCGYHWSVYVIDLCARFMVVFTGSGERGDLEGITEAVMANRPYDIKFVEV